MADPLSNPPSAAPVGTLPQAGATIPPAPASEAAPISPETVKPLSKEEQMAAFEEDLKYNDWGHQPC